MKKVIALLGIVAFLFCGCTVKMENPTATTTTNNTDSNNNQSASTSQASTTPEITEVAGFSNYSQEKVVWGFGNVENHQQPSEPLSLQKTYSDLGGNWLLSKEKTICLTFDEGYENGFTPTILDTLKAKKIKAVFFVTYDFASQNPDLIQRMIDEGHVVGNHTYRHYTMDEQDIETQTEEVSYLHDYVEKNFNYTMSYFRFPKGEFSKQSLAVVNSLGYKSIFWSFAYADWDPESQMDEAEALEKLTSSTHDGEILLLHAVSQTNANILGDLIDDIQSQGYTFTTEVS
jgi:peptidoglycan-N-acetylmuramic acid deacetylase